MIYLYTCTKFYLNVTSSFKVISRTKYGMDGQTNKAATIIMLPPLPAFQLIICGSFLSEHFRTWPVNGRKNCGTVREGCNNGNT